MSVAASSICRPASHRWCAARPGLVVPDLEALLKRLEYAKKFLEGTKFSYKQVGNVVETTCPWGNRIRMHGPEPENFGPMRLGMPYVEFDVAAGTDLSGIARFYTEILGGIAGVSKDERGPYAWANTSADSKVIYRETDKPLPPYDGHHIQITLADFSGPHKKLVERGLITEESDQHQYRFVDIVDLDTNKSLPRSSTRRAACAIRCSTGPTSTGTRT